MLIGWITVIILDLSASVLNFQVYISTLFLSLLRTPLMLSVLNGHTDCVYSLLNKGADVDAKDKWGRTALHRGVREYSLSFISSFLQLISKKDLIGSVNEFLIIPILPF